MPWQHRRCLDDSLHQQHESLLQRTGRLNEANPQPFAMLSHLQRHAKRVNMNEIIFGRRIPFDAVKGRSRSSWGLLGSPVDERRHHSVKPRHTRKKRGFLDARHADVLIFVDEDELLKRWLREAVLVVLLQNTKRQLFVKPSTTTARKQKHCSRHGNQDGKNRTAE